MLGTRGRWPVSQGVSATRTRTSHTLLRRFKPRVPNPIRKAMSDDSMAERHRAIRDLISTLSARSSDSPIRLGCQSASRESVTALSAIFYCAWISVSRVKVLVPETARKKRARAAFREAQFLSEVRVVIHRDSAPCSFTPTSSCARFFAKSDLRS